jgi:hypothetical protein
LVNVLFLTIYHDKHLLLPVKGNSTIYALLFLLVVFYTMLARGIGFEMLGSSKSGGMFYVKIFAIMLLFIFTLKIKVSDRYISILFISYLISCLLPFLSDLVYLMLGHETFFHKFIPAGTTLEFYAENEGSVFRIQSASSVAEYSVAFMLVFFPLFDETGKFRITKTNIAIILFALLMVGLSGHRISLVGIALILLYFYNYSFGLKRLIRPIIIGVVIAFAVSVFAVLEFEKLPSSFQRVFSFLPFTPSNETTVDASASLEFRVLMAAKAIVMLPDYFLLGKGFAFVNREVEITDYFGTIDFFADMGVFHNGLLGLVINLGLPGLLAGLALMRSIYKFSKDEKTVASNGIIQRINILIKSKILLSITYFVFLYGDVQTNFIELIILGILYKLISYHITVQKEARNASVI